MFKVGDRVKVIVTEKEVGDIYPGWNSSMARIESFVIGSMFDTTVYGETVKCCRNETKGSEASWMWRLDWLRLAEPKENPTYAQLLEKMKC